MGTVIAVQLYELYGQINYAWGSMPTSHNYTGQRLDSQSGLLSYQFRWYDPFSGQFTRTATKQNNAQGFNPYAYVSDNPETKNDPTGHWGWGAILAVVAVVVVVAVVAVVAAPVVIAAAGAAAEVAADGAVAGAVAEGAVDAAAAGGEAAAAAGGEAAAAAGGEAAATAGGEAAATGGEAAADASADATADTATDASSEVGPENQLDTMENETTQDLYRSGNSTSPRYNNVRLGKECFPDPNDPDPLDPNNPNDLNNRTFLQPGQTPANGLSNTSTPQTSKGWWRLPSGSRIPQGLRYVNDHDDHWALEPTQVMSRGDYIRLAMQLSEQFVEAWL